MTVNVCPPAVTVPVRGVVVVFAATLNVTVPLPDPAPVTVIQAAVLAALQGHPAAVVIANEPLPPEAGIDCDIGEMAYEHVAVAPACVIDTTCPPMVTVPVRDDVSVFGATESVIVPPPVPLAPALIVIQLVLLEVLHAHAAPVVMVTKMGPPAAGTVCDVGLTEYVHGAAAAWSIVNVLPAMVIVPVRDVVALLADTLKVTVPPPDPLAPAVTTIQLALLAALHVQPPAVVTVDEPLPPADGIDCDAGEIEYAHGAAAACVMLKVCPAILMVPVRCVVAVLAATLNVTVPLPDPLAPPVMVLHATLLTAVQLHPADAATANDPLPPAAETD